MRGDGLTNTVVKGKRIVVDHRYIRFVIEEELTPQGQLGTWTASVPVELLKEAIRALKNLSSDTNYRKLYWPTIKLSTMPGILNLEMYSHSSGPILFILHERDGTLYRHRFMYVDVLEAMLEVDQKEVESARNEKSCEGWKNANGAWE